MIKIVYDIKIYRQALKEIINVDDVVVELGCHLGNSTRIMSKLAAEGNIISLDKGSDSPESMKALMEEQSNIKFLNADVRLHTTLENVVKKISNCDVLSIDLGGGYHPDTVFKVFFIWSSTLKPRDTIIRNRGLLDFVQSSLFEEVIESHNGWLESSGNDGIPPRLKELKLWSTKL